jgi:hypothetical protein
MNFSDQQSGGKWIVMLLGGVILGGAVFLRLPDNKPLPPAPAPQTADIAKAPRTASFTRSTPTAILTEGVPVAVEPRSISSKIETNRWTNEFVFWWDKPSEAALASRVDTGKSSNIRKADYVGPESCRECHEANYHDWSRHGHRYMTGKTTPDRVFGDFSGKTIKYQGGEGHFYKKDGKFRMRLSRNGKVWEYVLTRTIGWRHMQDYAGHLESGPDHPESARRNTEHVMPFGYDIGSKAWMPTVHVFPDYDIPDSFEPHRIAPYDGGCSDCHNTYPTGDRMIRNVGWARWTGYVPRQTSLHLAAYLSDAHPNLMVPNQKYADYPLEEIDKIGKKVSGFKLAETSIASGITCEACHFGCREHVENSSKEKSDSLPSFFPISPHLSTIAKSVEDLKSRNNENINFICARCHTGARQPYANGLHAWNSTEYTEAIAGHCYDPIKALGSSKNSMACTHCHNPHKTVNLKWQDTPQRDDQRCLECHEKFKAEEKLIAHTHHAANSDGSRCMACHMPHTNEGLGRMVRTHRIFNPNEPELIEANQVNACNLCHLDKPIDWTLTHLTTWYGENKINPARIAANYPNRERAVVLDWLRSDHQPTRISTAGAIARRRAYEFAPQLIDRLVREDYMPNRRMMQKAVEELLEVNLRKKGFEHHLTALRRSLIMNGLKKDLLKKAEDLAKVRGKLTAR